ncbi:MAG: hypothetical protein AAGE52_42225 [Myxococcota bacterium]
MRVPLDTTDCIRPLRVVAHGATCGGAFLVSFRLQHTKYALAGIAEGDDARRACDLLVDSLEGWKGRDALAALRRGLQVVHAPARATVVLFRGRMIHLAQGGPSSVFLVRDRQLSRLSAKGSAHHPLLVTSAGQPGDRVLLASDSLVQHHRAQTITDTLATLPAEVAATRLVGEDHNFTAVVAHLR